MTNTQKNMLNFVDYCLRYSQNLKYSFKMRILLILSFLLPLFTLHSQHEEHNDIDDIACKEAARSFDTNRTGLTNVIANDYDLNYYRFRLNIDPAVYNIDAKVDIHFTSLIENFSTLHFDFATVLNVDSIVYGNQLLSSFEKIGDFELKVTLPQSLAINTIDSISIFYHGAPPSGGFGSFIKTTHNEEAIIWTLSEPFGARDWWPCKNGLEDKIDSIDMYISCPSKYKAASNGILVNEWMSDSTTLFHWKHRYSIAPYLIAFAVTNYERYTDQVILSNGVSMPMINYVYPENLNDAKTGTANLVQVLQFYDSLFVGYPFQKEKYGHAQFGWGGGMEHQTMSFVVSYGWLLLSHELAHQWFGDMVTCGSWQDIWLNEGFATYLEGLSRERFPDKADFDFKTWKAGKVSHITSQPGGSVIVSDTTSVGRIFNGRLSYSKGSYLLHMLRWKLGDEKFFKGIRNYLGELKFKYARTTDLMDHLELVSDMDLKEFFNDWFYGEGYPSYHLSYQLNDDNSIALRLNQTTSHPSVTFFEMPVPVYFSNGIKDTIVVLDHLYDGQEYSLNLGFKPDSIAVDPDQWLISANNTVEEGMINKTNDYSNFIQVSPNPFKDEIKINTAFNNMSLFYRLYNTQSKIISSGFLNPEYRLQIEGNPGIYFIEIFQSGGQRNISKLIKL